MFILRASNGKFYNGRAGEGWLGERADAFKMGKGEAEHKANSFNGMTLLHRLTFTVEEF